MSWPRTAAEAGPAPQALPPRDALWRTAREIGAALSQDDPIAHRYLLLMRFTLANSIAVALVGAAAGMGWIQALLAADGSVYSLAIVLVFVVGLFWSGQRVAQLSRSLNEIKGYEVGRYEGGARLSARDRGPRRPEPRDPRLDAQAAARVPHRPDPARRQQPGPARTDRHGHRLHHRALGGAPGLPPRT